MKEKKDQLMLVKWVDAGLTSEWCHRDEIDHGGAQITSAGFVIHETSKSMTLSLSIQDGTPRVSGSLTIPKGWIKSKRKLR